MVTRTSCVLYSLQEDGVRRMTSYLINSRKKPYRILEENRFSYSVRFYFTSAKVIKASDDGSSNSETKATGKKPQGVGLLGPEFNVNGQIPPSALGLDGGTSEAAIDNLYGGF